MDSEALSACLPLKLLSERRNWIELDYAAFFLGRQRTVYRRELIIVFTGQEVGTGQ